MERTLFLILSMVLVVRTGTSNEDGTFVARPDAETEGMGEVTLHWGADVTEQAKFMAFVDSGVGSSILGGALNEYPDIMEQVSDFLARACGYNILAQDRELMTTTELRWADEDCQDDIPEGRFTPKLSPYTTSMIGALNIGALGNNARNAWTRAYGASVGLLPNDESIHDREYVLTSAIASWRNAHKMVTSSPKMVAGPPFTS